MIVSNRPTQEELLQTFAPFINKTQINKTTSSPKLSQNDQFEKKYGIIYTGTALAAGAGILYFLHRGGKLFNFTNFVKKYATKLTAKTIESLQNAKTSNIDFIQRIKLNTSLKISNGLKKLQGLGNINPIKDIAADTFLKKIRLKPMFDRITKLFTAYGKNLALKKYKIPQEDLAKLQKSFEEAAQIIEKLPANSLKNSSPKILSEKLRKLSTFSQTELEDIIKNFGSRFDEIVDVLNKNSETEFLKVMKNLKGNSLKQKIIEKFKEFGDFIPEKTMEPYKKRIFSPLFKSKSKISNSVIDLHKNLTNSINNIFYDNSLQNSELRKCYLDLCDLAEKFKNPKKYNLNRIDVKKDLVKALETASKKFQELKPETNKSKLVKELLDLVQNDQKGAIEEAINICKILKEHNPSLYIKLITQRNKFQKSFNRAIDFETDKTYRKLLDFSLHSLATDLFTQALGIGSILYILMNSKKSKEEKISANLKTGIPVAGGLIIGFLCNLRQVASGPGALFFATIAGLILNRIGTVTNNFYLKSHNLNTKA